MELNTGLDFDLGSITRGLKASVYFSFDMFSMFTEDLLNTYAVYNPTYAGDSISFSKYGVDAKVDEQTVTDVFYYRRTGIYGTIDYNRSFGDHEIKATGLAYRDQYSVEEVLQPTKHLHFGVRANYIFQKKYIAELTGVLAGSSKFFETDPYAFSPGIGLGWILSEESFLKNNPVISYLKIRTNWAINNNDETISDFYLGRDYYSEGSGYIYNHRNADNLARMLSSGNPDLKWEKDMSINIGFESMLFDYKLGVEASYFFDKSYDLVTQRSNTIPVYYSSLPYENYGSVPDPFFVIATQNPIEQEGTYPLPEAQLDRFMFNVFVDYPTQAEEEKILTETTSGRVPELGVVFTARQILNMQRLVTSMPVSEYVVKYVPCLVRATRPKDPTAPDFVKTMVDWGAGPRAGQYLILGGKAFAAMEGRYTVSVSDVRRVATPVLRHRIGCNFAAGSEGID